jgi:hypothetical protein
LVLTAQRVRAFAEPPSVVGNELFGYDQFGLKKRIFSNATAKVRKNRHNDMEIKIQLSEQEQHWLEQIAADGDVSPSDAIKNLIKEKHETMTMKLAFEQYPDGKTEAPDAAADNSRSSRKAALKRSLIERASQSTIDRSDTEM